MLQSSLIRSADRKVALERMNALLERTPQYKAAELKATSAESSAEGPSPIVYSAHLSRVNELLLQAGWGRSSGRHAAAVVYLAAFLCGCCFAVGASTIVSGYFVPLFFLAGLRAPFSFIETRIQKRAMEFAEDYPTVLLATASSMKVGMTAYAALERSIKLLPEKSLVRQEVKQLVADLRRGLGKQEALQRFGESIRQPDLALFRSAFLLVLENGGRFAPTLQRLATVSKDRLVLISASRVSTASMRMTANIILGVAPLIMSVVGARTPEFWDLMLHHPVANTMASAGIVIIFFCYLILKRMSNFKP